MWTYRPVLEALIDIYDLEDAPPTPFPAFTSALLPGCPPWVEHRCSYEERWRFLYAIPEGTWRDTSEHVTQVGILPGLPGGFGKAPRRRSPWCKVGRAGLARITRAAPARGRDLVMAAIEDKTRSMSLATA